LTGFELDSPFLECADDGEEFFVVDSVVALCGDQALGVKGY
jgi:hypothetical protein